MTNPTGDAMVNSTSDERVVVTSNIMRHKYRKLSDAEQQQMQSVKDQGLLFIQGLHSLGGTDPTGERQGSRELSIAQTKMEEAVMWAVKHLTR